MTTQQYLEINTVDELRGKIKQITDQFTDQQKECYRKLKADLESKKKIFDIESKTGGNTPEQKKYYWKVYQEAYDQRYRFEKNYGIFKLCLDYYRTQCMKSGKKLDDRRII